MVGTDGVIQSELAERIARVRTTIADAAVRVGRRPQEITLVAVSKTVEPDRIRAAAELGITHFGENRVQEGREKIELLAGRLPPGCHWHLIGHLQSNKARWAVRLFDLIESVDSLELATLLDRLGERQGKRVPVLLEVNVSGEEAKFGFAPLELSTVMPRLVALRWLEIRGLMAIAPIVTDPKQARPFFRQLRQLRDQLRRDLPGIALEDLSMGMTNDYPVAIEEGATIVRIGRAIFGERLS